ncbi:MAG TPA: AIR synthase related protein, partial [Longimicrobiales bacterium]|nr:AIR synthase related protein [Longimicrobiales bacterium]
MAAMTQNQLGPGREFDLIREFVRAARSSDTVIVGPGDDCAVFAGGLVMSTDASIEGVHFRRDWLTPLEIGQRAAAIALSDLAAMAAEPLAVLAALALPRPDYGDFAI